MGHTAHSLPGKIKIIWLLVALPLVLGACHNILGKRVRGNGNIKTEDRSVSDFKNVEVDGAAKVLVSQSDHSSVRIECDENLLGYMEVSQQGDRVIIRERHGYHLVPTNDIKVYVSTKVYNQIKVSGAVDIIGQSKISNPEDLALSVSGAGDIKMDVDAPRLTADVSGSRCLHQS